MFTLQTLVMPHLGFTAPEDMYVRLHTSEVSASLKEQRIVFRQHGRGSFDTYFNSVSVGAWKKNCKIDDISINLRGEGEFILRFGLHKIGQAHVWLDEQRVTLNHEDQYFNCERWPDIADGMLYVYLESVFGGALHGGGWVTSTPPVRDVKLGIVITHFNRKQYVLPAIQRIREQLLSDENFKNKIELVVVDNSKNITQDEAQGITLIPNKNLGGSGGFMRGLLHLKDTPGFTHCLFMDDDASCEMESIRRAYNLLSYSDVTNMAVAGALLRELEPFRLFEKGALFNGTCVPLKSGMNMVNIDDLLFAELIDRTPDYGGWWFFAFMIDTITEWSFPFFVRGDDSRFSMKNDFKIVSMNGISCWGDDFALKQGPLPNYLDCRYHLLHKINIQKGGIHDAQRICNHFVAKQLISYNYASARAARMAIQHVMKGPEFFLKHMDMSGIRHEIAQFSSDEKLIQIERNVFPIIYNGVKEGGIGRFIRNVTLNGFLLPSFMIKRHGVVFQHKGFMANTEEIYRFNEVLYEYEPSHMGYVTKHDKKTFFKEYWTYLAVMRDFKKNFERTKKMWAEGFPKMTSEDFWRDVYKDE